MSSVTKGPYSGTRTWRPAASVNVGQVNAAIVKMRDDYDWKPLTVIDRGTTREFPPKNPRK